MTQQEIEAVQAQRRAEHEAKMQVLHAQEVEIQKQKNILKAEYKAGNKIIPSERFVIFYTSSTHRTALKEQNGVKLGFRFINATPDEPCAHTLTSLAARRSANTKD